MIFASTQSRSWLSATVRQWISLNKHDSITYGYGSKASPIGANQVGGSVQSLTLRLKRGHG